jgi:dipeptidyl aminopeptidase/acylaminoacyl peptidase
MNKYYFFILVGLLFPSVVFAQGKTSVNADQVYKTEFNILYRDKTKELTDYMESRCRLDVYYPVNKKDFATVIWFHGGGLLEGEKSIPENLKNKGISVIPVNYRFSPKVTCPAYIEDAAAAVAWVFNNISKYGGSPDKIYVSGHSAGGYLTLMVGLDKYWLGKYNIDTNKIAGLFPFSGQTVTHSTIRRERKVSEVIPQIDEFAPINHARIDAPPLYLITGDKDLDMPARYAENEYLFEIMKATGNKTTKLFQLEGFDHNEMINPACHIILKYILK